MHLHVTFCFSFFYCGHSYVIDLSCILSCHCTFWSVRVCFLFTFWLLTHKHLRSLESIPLICHSSTLTDLWSFGGFNSAQVIIRMSQSAETQGTWKWSTERAMGWGRKCWCGGLEKMHVGSVFLHPSAPCLRWPECPSVWSLECCRNSSAGKNKKTHPRKVLFHGQSRSDGLG